MKGVGALWFVGEGGWSRGLLVKGVGVVGGRLRYGALWFVGEGGWSVVVCW